MKRWILMTTGALVAIWGCDRAQVKEDQPAVQFKADVEAKLTEFESRIAQLEQRKDELPAAQADVVKTQTEVAEERIETLRDTSLPKLTEAAGEDQLKSIKSNVNDTLSQIDKEIREAESVVAKPVREPGEPAIPDLPATFPS